jgi:hypothetical protein
VPRKRGLDLGDGFTRAVGQRGTIVVGRAPEAGHVLTKQLGLAGRGGGIEAVEINKHPRILPGWLLFQKSARQSSKQ